MKTRRMISVLLALAMFLCLLPAATAEEGLFTQSAYLDGMDLPAVADRLPKASDVMVEKVEEIGQYFSSITLLQGDSKWGPGKPTEEALFRFKNDGTVEPNVAKGFDVNADFTVWTIYLREGMKWSDGEPFTSEDCRFFYEDLLVPGVTTKSVWEALKAEDENGEKQNAVMEVIDDYTFTMTFVSPKPEFLRELAINGKWFFAPKHWLQDKIWGVNAKTGEAYLSEDDALKVAEQFGYATLKDLGNNLTYYYWLVQGRPTLRAWTISGDFTDELCVWTRNPYYWKVDEEGKQLPYADELRFRRYSDASQALLWTMDGTSDINSVSLGDVETILNQATADITLVEWSSTDWASQSMQLNLAVQDEAKRALFQNVDFRHALSIAVNREQIAALVDNGFTEPAQSAPGIGAQGYSEEWSNKWTEYDVAGAQALLEQCGLAKDADGYYAFADGTRLVLNLQYDDENNAAFAELLKNDLDIAGVEATTRMYDRSIMEEMRASNTHEIVLNYEDFNTVSLSLRPDYFIPMRDYCVWGTAFGMWYLTQKDGNAREAAVEPPEDVKALLATYDRMMASQTSEEKEAVALELLDQLEEGIYEIGFTSAQPSVYAINAKMHNFPENAFDCDEFRNLGIANFACLWIEE